MVKRGDWILSYGPFSTVTLKYYTKGPSEMHSGIRGKEIAGERIPPHTFIGPVHDVDDRHPEYIAVLLPIRDTGTLGWVNVQHKPQPWSEVKFAQIVSKDTLVNWFMRGYQNVFYD